MEIIAIGRLLANAISLHLKNQYGALYRIFFPHLHLNDVASLEWRFTFCTDRKPI